MDDAREKVIPEYTIITKRMIRAKTYDDLKLIVRHEMEELIREADQKKARNKKKGWLFALIVMGLLLVGGIYAVNVFSEEVSTPVEQQKQSLSKTTAESPTQSDLIEGLRLAAAQQHKEAIEYFERLDYTQLKKEDQITVLFTYLLAGEAQKALDLEPGFAETVVGYFVETKNLEAVKKLKSNSPVIQFEQAALEQDAEQVLQLKDQVKLDFRRGKLIINAYIQKKEFKEATEFAQQTGNGDLIHYSLIRVNEEISK